MTAQTVGERTLHLPGFTSIRFDLLDVNAEIIRSQTLVGRAILTFNGDWLDYSTDFDGRGSSLIVLENRYDYGSDIEEYDEPKLVGVKLELPKDHQDVEINVDTVTGNLDVRDVEAREMRIKSKSGKIAIIDTFVDHARIETQSGDIKVDGTTSSSIFVAQTHNGEICVDNESVAPVWDLSCITGRINVGALVVGNVQSSMAAVNI